jgi:hypothetical protein
MDFIFNAKRKSPARYDPLTGGSMIFGGHFPGLPGEREILGHPPLKDFSSFLLEMT